MLRLDAARGIVWPLEVVVRLALPVLLIATLGCAGLGGPAPMEGVWCQSDTSYCYEFVGDVVTEDLGPNRRESGTWSIEDDLLLLHYENPSQTITWVIEKRTDHALILFDPQSDEIFQMNRYDAMPPMSDRPR